MRGNLLVADYFRARDGRTVWKFSTHTYVRPHPVFVPLEDRPEAGGVEDDHETLAVLGV